MKNDMLQMLTRFHREIALPDVQRIVDQAVGTLRNDMNSHFDGVYARFDRLESEYYALKSWMSRLDERLARIESEVQSLNGRMGRVESEVQSLNGRMGCVESEVQSLNARMAQTELQAVKSNLVALEMRVTDIEKKIDRLATETELVEIRQQILILNDRIAALETRH
jgi:chromosome segregation ATPase